MSMNPQTNRQAIEAVIHHTMQIGEVLLEVLHPDFPELTIETRRLLWKKTKANLDALRSLRRSNSGNR